MVVVLNVGVQPKIKSALYFLKYHGNKVVITSIDKLEKAIGVEPTVHLDPVHPNDPLVQEVNKVLSLLYESDGRITDIHDVRIVNTENHHVILFGINIQLGISQKEIVSCTLNLENRLKEKFKNYEINIKVSPLHRF